MALLRVGPHNIGTEAQRTQSRDMGYTTILDWDTDHTTILD